jgi:nitrogen fixation protein NifU and related proteins
MSADDRSSVPLRALYQEVILDHYRRPRNVGEPEGEHVTVRKRNPTCGDEITLHLSVIDGRIAEGRFQGQGCSISQASASMMTELVRGKSPE